MTGKKTNLDDINPYATLFNRISTMAAEQKEPFVILVSGKCPTPLCEPIDLSLLPERPSFQKTDVFVQAERIAPGHAVFEQGFDFVTEDVFNAVKELEASWGNEYVSAVRYTDERVDQIWTRTESLPLERLNSQYDIHHVNNVCFDQEDLDDLAKLRTLYPELHMLSDFTLSGLYDSYQQDVNDVGSYEIYRTDDFLYYLIGIVSDQEGKPWRAIDFGHFVCYALLQGKPIEEAISFCKSVNDYKNALIKINYRIANAMSFFLQEKSVFPEE